MKTWKWLACTMFVAAAMLPGCAVEPADEEVESVDDALTYASLRGTWTGVEGHVYSIYSLTFTKEPAVTLGGLRGYKFTASVDSGIRCSTASCNTASVTVSGVYKVVGTKLTLAAYDRPSPMVAKNFGDYKVGTKDKGTTIRLTKIGSTATETFTKNADGV